MLIEHLGASFPHRQALAPKQPTMVVEIPKSLPVGAVKDRTPNSATTCRPLLFLSKTYSHDTPTPVTWIDPIPTIPPGPFFPSVIRWIGRSLNNKTNREEGRWQTTPASKRGGEDKMDSNPHLML